MYSITFAHDRAVKRRTASGRARSSARFGSCVSRFASDWASKPLFYHYCYY